MDGKIRRKLFKIPLNIRFSIIILLLVYVPVVVMSGIIFRNMEDRSVEQIETDFESRRREILGHINTRIEAADTAGRLFLTNSNLVSILERAASGSEADFDEVLDFAKGSGAVLSGSVENNPLLHAVRAYGTNDNVQEIMPILYNSTRMQKLAWSSEKKLRGWHFDYYDTTFGSLTENSDIPLACEIMVVNGYAYGTVGYVESAIRMDELFPEMYDVEDGSSFFFFSGKNDGTILGAASDEQKNAADELLGLKVRMHDGVERVSLAGDDWLVFDIAQSDLGGSYYGMRNISDEIDAVRSQRNLFYIAIAGSFFLIALIINLIVRWMLGRLYSILDSMREVKGGDLSVRTEVTDGDEVGELGRQMNDMLDRIEILMEENVKREILVRNAGIRSLQNQINAHFINNVLESIKMLAEVDGEYLISDSITSLGKLLRYSIRWKESEVALREEINYIENYIMLMNLRNDFTVILTKSIPDELYDQIIPKMSLQPIVENSILHGIAPIGEDATIYIKAYSDDENVWIEVSDNGQGMDAETLSKLQIRIDGALETDDEEGHGVGIKNVSDRIGLSFGKEYGISIASEEGKYTKTTMHLSRRKAEK